MPEFQFDVTVSTYGDTREQARQTVEEFLDLAGYNGCAAQMKGQPLCAGITAAGEPCRRRAEIGNTYCRDHDLAKKERWEKEREIDRLLARQEVVIDAYDQAADGGEKQRAYARMVALNQELREIEAWFDDAR